MDEALVPLTETQNIDLVAPEKSKIIFENIYHVYFSSYNKLFCSLKAPPVV